MIVKNVYIMSRDNHVILAASNFKLIYQALIKYRDRLGIKEIQAYSTLVAKARAGKILSFHTEGIQSYFVEQMSVARTEINHYELSGRPF